MSATQTTLIEYLRNALVIEESVDMKQKRLREHERNAEAASPAMSPSGSRS